MSAKIKVRICATVKNAPQVLFEKIKEDEYFVHRGKLYQRDSFTSGRNLADDSDYPDFRDEQLVHPVTIEYFATPKKTKVAAKKVKAKKAKRVRR